MGHQWENYIRLDWLVGPIVVYGQMRTLELEFVDKDSSIEGGQRHRVYDTGWP